MHRYVASIAWEREGAVFTDNKYSRAHEWTFDGGITVAGSSSPSVVKLPYSDEHAVDPEEALIAAAASCHMLSFLYLAAKRGYVVDRYIDEALGVMERNAEGKLAITKITLRPEIEFSGEKTPSAAELADLHHQAHEECYIASSIRSEVVVESSSPGQGAGAMV
jgi:organic hydroperoxide reductase OsmC/OhrA